MTIRICLFISAFIALSQVYGVSISNLNEACFRCICTAATGCNATACVDGYCGPFRISNIFWIEADQPVLPDDDPVRTGAYEDCAREYTCAKRIVQNYMTKFGRDCNKDLVTDCLDYATIHFRGGYGCEESIEGIGYHSRFVQCQRSTGLV